MSSLREKFYTGFLWQGLERLGSQGTQMLISILLARLLSPKEFGVIAIMMVFITIGYICIDGGFSMALVQKKDIDDQDCSAVFYLNIAMSMVFYLVVFIVAPFIAKYYANESICTYLRVLASVFVIRAFSIVQTALLTKRMLFKFNFRINITAIAISGISGIILAYCGFGVWSLIVQQIINVFVTGCLLWFFVKWRPLLVFSWHSLIVLFNFGWKLLLSGLMNTLYGNLYSLIIGKLFNLDTLAYYNQGRQFPQQGMDTFGSVFGSVIFPGFASLQNDRPRLKSIFERALKAINCITTPVLCCLLVVAKQVVLLLLGEKWLPCMPYMQLSCIVFIFYPLHTLNLQTLNACGRSDVFLILEIIKKSQSILMMFITYRYGVMAMVWGMVITAPIAFIENAWMSKKLISYSCWRQLLHVFPFFAIGLVSGLAAYFVNLGLDNAWIPLISKSIIFMACYFLLVNISGQFPVELKRLFLAIASATKKQ